MKKKRKRGSKTVARSIFKAVTFLFLKELLAPKQKEKRTKKKKKSISYVKKDVILKTLNQK